MALENGVQVFRALRLECVDQINRGGIRSLLIGKLLQQFAQRLVYLGLSHHFLQVVHHTAAFVGPTGPTGKQCTFRVSLCRTDDIRFIATTGSAISQMTVWPPFGSRLVLNRSLLRFTLRGSAL